MKKLLKGVVNFTLKIGGIFNRINRKQLYAPFQKALVRGSFVAMDIVEALGRGVGGDDRETKENTEANTRNKQKIYSAFSYNDNDADLSRQDNEATPWNK